MVTLLEGRHIQFFFTKKLDSSGYFNKYYKVYVCVPINPYNAEYFLYRP